MSVVVIEPTTNGGKPAIDTSRPYTVVFTVEGTAPILFHAWNNESVEAKSKAAKNSAAKKSDDIESYVYRCEDGTLGIPGQNLHRSIIEAAKFRQDPRSPRKSAADLYKAGVVALTALASLGEKDWHFIDKRRVMVQRNAITRCRPGMGTGWRTEFEFAVLTPEYITPHDLLDVVGQAGRLIGLCDNRPTYGRFAVVNFEIMDQA